MTITRSAGLASATVNCRMSYCCCRVSFEAVLGTDPDVTTPHQSPEICAGGGSQRRNSLESAPLVRAVHALLSLPNHALILAIRDASVRNTNTWEETLEQHSTRRDFVKAAVSAPAVLSLAGLAQGSAQQLPIKAGQIGTRHAHAAGQIMTMRKFPREFEVVGVVEPDRQRREQLAEHEAYRGLNWMTEQELLGTPGLQAVAVETEVRDLLPIAQKCIEAGVHIHLDKPAGESYSELERLHTTAAQQSLTIQMGYMFRYNPAFHFLFQAARDGWLGDIFEVHGVISKKISANRRRPLAEYPGGSMFELGCHLVDPILHLMGEPDRVTGYIRSTRPELDALADNTLAVLEYPEATVTIRSTLTEVDGGRRRQCVVCGDAGTIVIRPLEPPRLELTLETDRGPYRKGTQVVELPRSAGRYDGAWLDFAKVIRGHKQHDFSPEHDLAVQRTLLTACQLPLNSVG